MTISLPIDIETPQQAEALRRNAGDAAQFLKAISHEGRLMILCHLVSGEKSVTELETLLQVRQAAVSQQLARLRSEGLVVSRREGKGIFYSLADEKPKVLLECVHGLFCAESATAEA
ncbi:MULTISPECIES: ArsR/SmtB family transcription factor [unclassified Roseivivax]|uniref:ArsR/SmtB family transcription factor n=1 Tax=Roseivivax sp. GX 12232 TaxID=2900547 RepID=UPI001E3AAC0F|nr:metalloregulator ArsR/SmtB family transcription factor [Roseivivax sp. GX 12232]MCE0506859.1 metalloregulator ArsR/SmtB family transcription factor [Roseivivax sp. GX 12232]